jgi:hypothetical protein
MITLSEINDAYRNATEEERREFINLILPDLKESPFFKAAVETVIVTSDLEIPSRLRAVEKVTGTYIFDEWEEHEPTLPERIEALEQRTVLAPENPHELDERETYMPSSKIGKAAIELIKFASTRPIVDGSKTITNSVLHQFRNHILPEELRPKESYARQWKRELTDIVCELAPVRKDKKGNNRGVRLVFPKNFDSGMTKCKLNVS